MIPGSEDLSGDEDLICTPPHNNDVSKTTAATTTAVATPVRLKRPRILRRRSSRSTINTVGKDWGERCVDVFEVCSFAVE